MSKKDEAAEILVALGEALNLAASVAELQTTDEARAEIYELLDAIAAYYGIERTEIVVESDGDSDIMVRYANDDDGEEEQESYIKLAVDNTDPKKMH